MNTEKAKELVLLNDHNSLRFKLNNQLFGDEGSTSTESGEGTETENRNSSTEDDNTGGSQETKTFTQEDVDKVVQKRIARELKKWEQEQQAAQTEAEKLASFNENQKKKYLEDKKAEELSNREKEITRRELRSTAKETLMSKGLPIELHECLVYEDAETCNSSIEAIGDAFQKAVQSAVAEKVQGGSTMKKSTMNGTGITKEQLATMSTKEINANWDKVQDLLKKDN